MAVTNCPICKTVFKKTTALVKAGTDIQKCPVCHKILPTKNWELLEILLE